MTEQKQIEEMAKDVCRSIVWDREEFAQIDCLETANILYSTGYRKQSEGEWEMQKFPLTQCSVCGVVRNCETEMGWNYCPNCGARMKGENK